LTAVGLSPWRALFLSGTDRNFIAIRKSQENLLGFVLTNTTIPYIDDTNDRAWTVSDDVKNAKHRLAAAQAPVQASINGKLRERLQAVPPGSLSNHGTKWFDKPDAHSFHMRGRKVMQATYSLRR